MFCIVYVHLPHKIYLYNKFFDSNKNKNFSFTSILYTKEKKVTIAERNSNPVNERVSVNNYINIVKSIFYFTHIYYIDYRLLFCTSNDYCFFVSVNVIKNNN